MPWPTAARMLKPSDDGLASEWPADAFVFMNPPFGRGQEAWMEKMANHPGAASPWCLREPRPAGSKVSC